MTQQAIHWARLATKNDPNTATLIVTSYTNWYQNYSPHTGPFPDTHILAYFAADTITYNVPTNSQNFYKSRIEPLAIHIFCIHHQHNNFGTPNQINTIKTTPKNLQISQYHIQKTPSTPSNTPISKNNPSITHTPPIPNYETQPTLKFPLQYNYYTDGSFIPPMKANDGHWKKKLDMESTTKNNKNTYIKKTAWPTNQL